MPNQPEDSSYTGPDFFKLGGAPMEDLIDAFDTAMRHPSPENVPPYVVQLGDFIVSKAVDLLRTGTIPEVSGAAVSLSQFLLKCPKVEGSYAEGLRLVDAASLVLSGSFHAGTEQALLRTQGGAAAKAFCITADTPEKMISEKKLAQELGFGHRSEEMRTLIFEMSQYNLMFCEFFGETDENGSPINTVYSHHLLSLGSTRYSNELLAVARHYAEPYEVPVEQETPITKD